jgi:hypothetical protein
VIYHTYRKRRNGVNGENGIPTVVTVFAVFRDPHTDATLVNEYPVMNYLEEVINAIQEQRGPKRSHETAQASYETRNTPCIYARKYISTVVCAHWGCFACLMGEIYSIKV